LITEMARTEKTELANDSIRIYTTPWCPDCFRAKSFLRQRGVSFEEINIEEAEGAAEIVMSLNSGRRRVPTFEVNGRTFHCSPYDPQKLVRELGLEEVPAAR
jgi:mycoredoxin